MKNLKIYIKTARFLISNIKKACNFYHLYHLFGYPDLSWLVTPSTDRGYRTKPRRFMTFRYARFSSRPPAYDKHISKTTVAIRHFADISLAGRPAEAVSA
ncbi:MAG: hypothetical protein KA059_03975 [Elusimicrobiales bacterium]|nr:hypothetical protein [Elusimicrobiales bacterium]